MKKMGLMIFCFWALMANSFAKVDKLSTIKLHPGESIVATVNDDGEKVKKSISCEERMDSDAIITRSQCDCRIDYHEDTSGYHLYMLNPDGSTVLIRSYLEHEYSDSYSDAKQACNKMLKELIHSGRCI